MHDPAFNTAWEEFENENGDTVLIEDVPDYVTRQQQENIRMDPGKLAYPVCYSQHFFPIFEQNLLS